jgi:hypothetical protein
MSLVPKNVDTSRLICVEPTLNMFAQLGVGEIITRRLQSVYDIDLSIQPQINRLMAQAGSFDEADGFCTIDLSSASDLISMNMIEATFPAEIVSLLKELRSPVTNINGINHSMNMVSTMGNGFTFPLQTAIFASVVLAAARSLGISLESKGPLPEFSVFGDDIIVRKNIFRSTIRLLNILGFRQNPLKTFSIGPFRESCGSDYYQGRNVRGVYVKRLRTDQDLCVTLNLLNEWSARTGISLPKTQKLLFSNIKEKLFVPFIEGNETGIRVPFKALNPQKTRFDCNESICYKRFEPHRKVVRIKDGYIQVPKGSKKLIYNPSGLLISMLQGGIRNGSISVRHDSGRFRSRLACIPYWDYMPVESSLGKEFSWQRWETVALDSVSF